ncbi:MAG: transcriptional coactivator p15/PC4 family protein [Candidatus Aerophobetes bacterium]|nr:transcriptional coactivator p15/PC4 family protein [Candidatus Aerophobetes bacterium]
MEKLVNVFSKNSAEEVRTQLTEYKGYKLMDIRVWYKREGEDARPTRKGLTLSVELYPELKKAIEELGKALKNNQGKS